MSERTSVEGSARSATSSTAEGELISAREAARMLDVKLQTLYAYASRGRLNPVKLEGRRRLYRREEVLRLAQRSQARGGHAAVASGALRWGEPVLESSITQIDAQLGPSYRGVLVSELLREGVSFERAAELLWTGSLENLVTAWIVPGAPGEGGGRSTAGAMARMIVPGTPPLDALQLAVSVWMLMDETRFGASAEQEFDRARGLILRMAAGLCLGKDSGRFGSALKAGSVAGAVTVALGSSPSPRVRRAIDAALVASLDHELNVSTFAARVTASSGADLYACVSSALGALSGPRHGGACDRVAALVAQIGSVDRVATELRSRTRRGETLAGFGHPLYPEGDPRATPLLELCRKQSNLPRKARTLLALVESMKKAGREGPTVDLGLVAIALTFGLGSESAAGLFAVGRAAGWAAHVVEQRESAHLLRPRARYVGS